jgi:hypothetical protein
VPSLTREVRSAAFGASGHCTLSIIARFGVRVALPASHDRPALTNATVAAPPRPPSSLRIVGPPSSKAAHFENTCRHELPRLMQRAAICCEQMRLSADPRSSHLSLPARH